MSKALPVKGTLCLRSSLLVVNKNLWADFFSFIVHVRIKDFWGSSAHPILIIRQGKI